MMRRGKRRYIRGITFSWPAAAFQAAVVFILPLFCQLSPNCASLQHCVVDKSHGEGCWQYIEVVPVVNTGAATDAPCAPSAGLRVPMAWQQGYSTQNCLLSHPLLLRAQQGSLRVGLPEAGVFCMWS